jgi:hypothetical protein
LDIDKIAGELLALGAITEEEYYSLPDISFKDSREFMYLYINSLHNKCELCTRSASRLKALDEDLMLSKKPNIVFVSDYPHYLDTAYGESFVNIKTIFEKYPNTLDQIRPFKVHLPMTKFPEVDLDRTEKSDLSYWQSVPDHLGPLNTPGQIFNYCISEAELTEDDYVIEYLARCPKFSGTTCASLSKKDLEVCSKWLKLKLYVLDPKIIVALGKNSTDFFIKTAVEPNTVIEGSPSLMSVTHPSAPFYKMQDASNIVNSIVDAFKKLKPFV